MIIAVADGSKAAEMSAWLQEHGISEDKVLWELPQREYEGYEMVFDEQESGQGI